MVKKALILALVLLSGCVPYWRYKEFGDARYWQGMEDGKVSCLSGQPEPAADYIPWSNFQ